MAQVTSNTVSGYFGEDYTKNAALHVYPQYFKDVIQIYGEEGRLLDFLRAMGQTMTIFNPKMTSILEGSLERSIITGSSIGNNNAGNSISLTLQSDQYDTNNACYLIVNESVLIPPKYLQDSPIGGRLYYVASVSGTAPALTFVLKPLDATSKIRVSIPAGTELMVGPTYFARESGQPGGKVRYEYEKNYYTQICKTSAKFGGGAVTYKLWRDMLNGGGSKTLIRGMEETTQRLDSDINKAILIAEPNTNAITATNTSDGTARTVLGTKGILPQMISEAQLLSYNDSYDISSFDAIKSILKGQMVTEREVNVFHGYQYGRRVENVFVNYIGDNSYTDLISNAMTLGFPIRRIFKNGCYFNFSEIQSFGNPTGFGVKDYPFPDLALIMPQSQTKVKTNALAEGGEKSLVMDNLTIGYLKYGGEDRTRIVKRIDGMTGIEMEGSNQYDEMNLYMLSEFMVIFNKVNQTILQYKE